jgi:hypothetical protein
LARRRDVAGADGRSDVRPIDRIEHAPNQWIRARAERGVVPVDCPRAFSADPSEVLDNIALGDVARGSPPRE